MSDTPRTDAMETSERFPGWPEYSLMTEHARDLERENARLRAALVDLENWSEAIRRELLDEGVDLRSTNFAAAQLAARAALNQDGNDKQEGGR